MKKLVSLVLIGYLSLSISHIGYGQGLNSFFNEANDFYQTYVQNGHVNYAQIKSKSNDIESLYRQINGMNLNNAGKVTVKAFYINAYNLIVIRQVVQNYSVKSVKDIEGFFNQQKHLVAGQKLSLDEIEKQKLSGDARLHFVLVCGAKGCPPLLNEAYFPFKLERQIDQQVKEALDNPAYIQVNNDTKKVGISKIFEWYSGDFTQNGQTYILYINKYRSRKIPTGYQAIFYEYDWNLNDTRAK